MSGTIGQLPLVTIGSGPDTIRFDAIENAYEGDAQLTVAVDGAQIGDVQTASAVYGRDSPQRFQINGDFGGGPHTVTFNFLNDAYGGTPALDRNLYISNVGSGVLTSSAFLSFFREGEQSTSIVVPPRPVTVGAGPDSIVLQMSEDAYGGDAQFTLGVDGVQVGGVLTTSALHSTGQEQIFTVLGTFGYGPHTLTVNFLNDLYDGSPDKDRNLYVDLITRGTSGRGSFPPLLGGGPVDIALGYTQPPAGPQTVGAGPDSLVVNISGDGEVFGTEYPAFTISVDGTQIGSTLYSTASHGSGTQAFTVLGSFGAGPHTVTINFLNDAYGGTPETDRNLWVDSIVSGGLVNAVNAPLYSQGPRSFDIQPPTAVLTGSDLTGPAEGRAVLNGTPGDDVITAHGAGNTITGLGGSDVLNGGEGGGDTITAGAKGDGLTMLADKIVVAGAGNVVTAGDEAVTLSGTASGTSAQLGNGSDTVALDGAGNALSIGYGANTIAMTGGSAVVNINGSGPPSGQVYRDAVTISGDHNNVGAFISQGKYPAGGDVSVDGGTGYGVFAFDGSSVTLHTDGPYNTVNLGPGTSDVTPGSGYDTVTVGGFPFTPVVTAHLAGQHNTVKSTSANLTVLGGDGYGTFNIAGDYTVGSGTVNVATGGAFNAITLIGGTSAVDAGSGDDTVSLMGGRSSLVFHGSGDMLFIQPGPPQSSNGGPATSVVDDQSTDLQIFVGDASLQSLDMRGFGPGGMVHLTGGAGGYATADQAFAALTPDGAGGAFLAVGSGTIHFEPGIQLNPDTFGIG